VSLNPVQQAVGDHLYGLARAKGLPDDRAREFVAASMAESGLNPQAVNKTSGAAGLFQLLSPGYRQKAQQAGGLLNPDANAGAILPDYLNFWRSHPSALPGAAGSAVERSGEGAGFYAKPLASLSGIGGGSVSPGLADARSMNRDQRSMIHGSLNAGGTDASRAFALALLQPGGFSPEGLMRAFQARSNATDSIQQVPAVSGPPGANGGVTAGDPAAEPHPHGATLGWLRNFVKPYRLTITSTTEGKHATHSYHYASRAIDVGGSHQQMLAVANAALKRPHDFTELFYGGAPSFIKNGQVYPISQLDPALKAEHMNHVHLAR
jgi:hypothetical protein